MYNVKFIILVILEKIEVNKTHYYGIHGRYTKKIMKSINYKHKKLPEHELQL